MTASVSWATENVGPGGHATIQAGINAASLGETVLVAPGTYNETLQITSEVVLQSSAGAATTIIDGGGSGTVISIEGASITRATVVEGFTIRDGHSAGGADGGGVTIRDSASPTIRDNIIELNRSDLSGGGIKASQGADPAILDNVIRNNTAAEAGGGVHIEGISGGASGVVRGNDIHDNSVDAFATSSGGGVKVGFATDVEIDDNDIFSNSVTFAGGGISAFASSVDITNNRINNNDGGRFAGGVHFETNTTYGPRTLLLEGNTIDMNEVTELGGGVHTQAFGTASSITLRNNTLSNNTALNPSCSSVSCPAATCGKAGGLSAQRSTAQSIEGNLFDSNRSDCYGAALLEGSPLDVTFLANTILDSSVVWNYPAVGCVDTSGCTIARNAFLNNGPEGFSAGAFNPGALYLKGSGSTVVENNHFSGNTGDFAGSIVARSITTPPAVLIRNNTFVDNTTAEVNTGTGGTVRTEVETDFFNNVFSGDVRGVALISSPDVSFRNNDFFNQTSGPTSQHATLGALESEAFASGNVEVDPQLAEPSLSPRLSLGSPVIDQGRCDLDAADDFDGDLRPPVDCDIGGDEYNESIFADGFESGNTSAWSQQG